MSYILVDAGGIPVWQMNVASGSRVAAALVQWGGQCAKAGKGFSYLAFSRKNGERVAMFRVGSGFLGVTLAQQPDASRSIAEIVRIINNLSLPRESSS